MARVTMITCRSCGTEVPSVVILCSNSECGRNPRDDPPRSADEASGTSTGLGSVADPANPAVTPPAATPFGAIRLTLPNHDSVELQAGERVILGRESPNERVARAFPAKLEDVSRQHVRVVNDASGPALVMLGETGGSVGGTFVGDRKLPNDEGERFPLHHGDRIRLGSLAWCKVEFIDA